MKDSLCSYYTNSEDITSYMVKRLNVFEGDIILEPSAGQGIFIDEIIQTKLAVKIDALDIDEKAISVLEQKYGKNPAITVRKTDTLLDHTLDSYSSIMLFLKQADTLIEEQLDFFSITGGHYDKIIGNPPYGAWQTLEHRDLLKKKYAGQYVKETYSLFLLRCTSVLKMHGRLSFIIPDTYLFLNMHTRLREILLTKTKIEEIIIFPSKFFPGVSFGYSNLSIITLERCESDEAKENKIRIIKGFKSSKEFDYAFKDESTFPSHLKSYYLKQDNILHNQQSTFVLADENQIEILQNKEISLGDVADIVTGFYTGDNKRFIRVRNTTVKGSKHYKIVNMHDVYKCSSLEGIDISQDAFIPYVKSSSNQKYLRETDDWFVQWNRETIQFYMNDKKARFQNSTFYFKTGIGIPMVKSNSIKAFLLKDRVFDQSIVGIFPKNPDDMLYLLALMNSDVINDLIHIINPTANNSANYIKQLPYINPSAKIKMQVTKSVNNILELLKENKVKDAMIIHGKLNALISELYKERPR